MHACVLRHFGCVRLCATPETAAHQAPPSLGFSRQEHWEWVAIAFSDMCSYATLISTEYSYYCCFGI